MAYKNYEQGLVYGRKYYLEHRDHKLAVEKEYAKKNKEPMKEYRHQWHIDNREREMQLGRAWELAHPGNAAARVRKWHHTPSGIVYVRRAARKAQAERRTRCFLDMKAFDVKCEHLGWRCQICGKELTRETVAVDHVIPCKYGGTNDTGNLQPLCMSCNRKKGTKSMGEMLGSAFLFD